MKAHDIADTRAEQPATESDARTPAGGGRRYQTRPFLHACRKRGRLILCRVG
jgi:hypothetical protein